MIHQLGDKAIWGRFLCTKSQVFNFLWKNNQANTSIRGTIFPDWFKSKTGLFDFWSKIDRKSYKKTPLNPLPKFRTCCWNFRNFSQTFSETPCTQLDKMHKNNANFIHSAPNTYFRLPYCRNTNQINLYLQFLHFYHFLSRNIKTPIFKNINISQICQIEQQLKNIIF